MAFTSTLVALLQKDVIRNLDRNTVIFPFANRKYEGDLRRQGDTVTVQTLPTIDWSRGGTAGAAITDSGFTVTSESLTVNEVDQVLVKIPDIDAVRYNRDAQADVSARLAEGIARYMDQYTASFAKDANSSNKLQTTGPGVTLSGSNVYGEMEALSKVLGEQNVPEGSQALFITPGVRSWLRKGNWIDSTEKGVGMRTTGMIGEVAGMKLYVTNNIPYVTDLTLDTNPTADDTFTVLGVTFTFKAVPSAAGEIDIGADAAATQANVVAAINGTGTPGATTYIELSAADRNTLKKGFVSITDFASDVATLHSSKTMATAETFTAATNVFSAEGRLVFAMDPDAVNVAAQLTQMKYTEETDAFAQNILGEYVYGGKVFAENAKRIATVRCANG